MSFKKYLQAEGKSKSTVERYYTHAIHFISWLDQDNTEIENSAAKEVLAYLNQLQKQGDSNTTRNLKLNAIKHFFNYQVRHGHRSDNPIQHLKLKGIQQKKLYPILSPQELQQLHDDYAKTTTLSQKRNKVILSLMIHQGLTTAEVNALKENDLKLREGTIYIAGSRKSNERTLELKSHQILDLMEYSLQLRPQLLACQANEMTDYLFLAVPMIGKAKAVEKQGRERLQVWKELSKTVKKQNPCFINFKQVRTSVITHWLKHYNLREVQYRAGHRYVSSTEAYLVNQIDDLQADIDKFHPIQ